MSRSRTRPATWILASCVIGHLLACGHGGDPRQPPVAEERARDLAPPPDPPTTLGVGVDSQVFHMGRAPACREVTTAAPWHDAGDHALTVDGRDDEWKDVPAAMEDAIGDTAIDSQGAADLEKVLLGGWDNNHQVGVLIGLENASSNESQTIEIEFGGIRVIDGLASSQTLRTVRWKAGHLEEQSLAGLWERLKPDTAQAARQGNVLEISFGWRYLSEVFLWPDWYARVRSTDGERQVDTVGTIVGESRLGREFSSFNYRSCGLDLGTRGMLSVLTLTPKALGSVAADEAWRATYLGLLDSHLAWTRPLPLRRIGLFVTRRSPLAMPGAWPSLGQGLGLYFWDVGAIDGEYRPNQVVSKMLWSALSTGHNLFLSQSRSAVELNALSSIQSALTIQDFRRLSGVRGFLSALSQARTSASDAERTGMILGTSMDRPSLLSTWLDSPSGSLTVDLSSYDRSLADEDGDGIPSYFEILGASPDDTPGRQAPDFFFRSSPSAYDSDDDGYSDASEVVASSDPGSNIEHPRDLVVDGMIVDWLDLLPQVFVADRGELGSQCARSSDATHYSAVRIDNTLVVGVSLGSRWDGTRQTRYEIAVDIAPKDRHILMVAHAGDSHVEFYDEHGGTQWDRIDRGYAMGFGDGIEAALATDSLLAGGLGDARTDDIFVRVRILELQTDHEIVCDETEWFRPIQSQGVWTLRAD